LDQFGEIARKKGKSIGIRINPECSTQVGHEIYDPCAPASRMGVRLEDFDFSRFSEFDGIHFHTLCEQNSDDLEKTLDVVEKKFGKIFSKLKWINFGGGHHITRSDYDVEKLEACIRRMQKYGLTVYLEPGEAVALYAGYLATTVLDFVENGKKIAILDSSAACHMPDVLEMPYRPPLKDAGRAGEKQFLYSLAGPTCLSGDVIGEYAFDHPLSIGDRLYFEDMAIYSMVKNNTFNGIPLPSIAVLEEDGGVQVIKTFGYSDFKERLS
jgi:carboxynorspermidine decarboxylase